VVRVGIALLPTLIVLARNTGRRISSILGLKWDDVDLDQGTIRWRAELDKKRKTWIAPMSTRARDALIAYRTSSSVIGPALLFPHPKLAKSHQPITRHLAAYYLKSAFALARLEQPDGSLWHVFRRVWATERKHLPLRDVAAAGGWSDITTLLTVYQQADEETMREVVDYVKPRSPRLPWQQSKVLRSR
jgi:integrase